MLRVSSTSSVNRLHSSAVSAISGIRQSWLNRCSAGVLHSQTRQRGLSSGARSSDARPFMPHIYAYLSSQSNASTPSVADIHQWMEYCIQNIIDCGVQCQSVADRQAQLKNETDMTPEAAQSKNEQLQAELQSAEQQWETHFALLLQTIQRQCDDESVGTSRGRRSWIVMGTLNAKLIQSAASIWQAPQFPPILSSMAALPSSAFRQAASATPISPSADSIQSTIAAVVQQQAVRVWSSLELLSDAPKFTHLRHILLPDSSVDRVRLGRAPPSSQDTSDSVSDSDELHKPVDPNALPVNVIRQLRALALLEQRLLAVRTPFNATRLSPLLVALCLSGQHAMAFELSLSIADFERSSLSGNDNTGDYLLSLPIWSFLLTALSTEPSLSRAACVFEHIRWRCHTFAVASSTASQWNTACPASLCAFITSWIIRGRPRGALMAVNRLRAVGMLSELERLAQIKVPRNAPARRLQRNLARWVRQQQSADVGAADGDTSIDELVFRLSSSTASAKSSTGHNADVDRRVDALLRAGQIDEALRTVGEMVSAQSPGGGDQTDLFSVCLYLVADTFLAHDNPMDAAQLVKFAIRRSRVRTGMSNLAPLVGIHSDERAATNAALLAQLRLPSVVKRALQRRQEREEARRAVVPPDPNEPRVRVVHWSSPEAVSALTKGVSQVEANQPHVPGLVRVPVLDAWDEEMATARQALRMAVKATGAGSVGFGLGALSTLLLGF